MLTAVTEIVTVHVCPVAKVTPVQWSPLGVTVNSDG